MSAEMLAEAAHREALQDLLHDGCDDRLFRHRQVLGKRLNAVAAPQVIGQRPAPFILPDLRCVCVVHSYVTSVRPSAGMPGSAGDKVTQNMGCPEGWGVAWSYCRAFSRHSPAKAQVSDGSLTPLAEPQCGP